MFDRKHLVSVVVGLFLLFPLSVGTASANEYDFGGGQGTLYYSSSETSSGTCGTYEHLYTWTEYTFSGFSYTDPNGVSWPFNTTALYFSSANGQGCPPNGGQATTFGASGFLITFRPLSSSSGSATIGWQGSLNPKYQVTAVYYAPPGSKSSASYSTTTMVGASATFSSSVTSSTTMSVSLGESANSIFGTGSFSSTSGTTLSQEGDSSSTIDVSYQTGQGYTIDGPSSDAAGVNHNYDIIAVWLNPVANITVSAGTIDWKNYSYDGRDPADNVELVIPYCWELENPDQIQGALRSYFNRTWDTNGPGAVTDSDFAAIAAHDPYCVDPGLNSVDPTRYQGPVNGSTIPYQPPPPGGPAFTWFWNSAYQATNSTGQGASASYSVGFSTSASYSIFGGLLSDELKNSNTLTWTNKWSQLETQRVTQNATVSITGPAYGSGYTGPEEFNMYQDNIYGTYMFFPVN